VKRNNKRLIVRVDVNLRQRYRAILSYTGIILLLVGLLMLTSLFALLSWPEEWVHCLGFVIPSAILVAFGIGVWIAFRPRIPTILTVQEGGVIVLFSWIIVCLFSALPFIIIQRLNFNQAIFESVSGWTTTGLSVIDVIKAPHIILLWRSIMQLAGGAGLAIIMLAAIAGPIGPGLSVAEGRSIQLAPHIRESTKLVVLIYSGYAFVGVIAYRFAGMSFFDAINHSFTAISTGGFSTQPGSIASWNSAAIEGVTIPLMILGSLNFLTAYLFLQRKFKAVYRNGEVRLFAILIPASVLILFVFVCRGIYPSISKGFRTAIFEAVTSLTTTGFSSTSYGNWNSMGFFVLIILMLIGGGTCSTAGGIKQYRIYLLFKALWWQLRRPFLPRTIVIQNYIWQGERKDYMSDSRINQVGIFIFLYLFSYFIGVGVLTANGYGLKESLFELASALGTVGLSVGITQANSPPLVLWVETFAMFLGRLEFFVILISIGKVINDFIMLIFAEKSA
jgi:trk system potassium uptake protein TrkH